MSEDVLVAAPVDQVRRRLLAQVRREGLQSAAGLTVAKGATLLGSCAAEVHDLKAAVHTLPSYRDGEVTVIPLRIYTYPVFHQRFPKVDANLELQSAGSATSRLGLIGSYRQESGESTPRSEQEDVRTATRQFLGRLASFLTLPWP